MSSGGMTVRVAQARRGTVLVANPSADLYGSDRMVVETVSAMCDAGWRVVASLPNDGPLADELSGSGAEVGYCRTPVVRKSALKPRGVLRLAVDCLSGVRPAVNTIRRIRPDVLYVNTVTTPLWLIVARLLGVPTVCHVHEGEASARTSVLRVLYAPLFLANQLIINSRFSRDVLARAYPSLGARAEVVYNSVRGPAEPTPARGRLETPCRLLYVGRQSPRKGLHVAVEAVRLLRDGGTPVHLDVVGTAFTGYEWFEDALARSIRDNGLTDLITFHGFQRAMSPFWAAADILLVPSTVDEPFGNTAVEAALAARPLVVSDIAGLKEAADGLSSAVWTRPGDAASLAGAVRRIVADWPAYRRRALDDAVFASTKYSPKTYGDRIAELLEAARRHEHRSDAGR